MATDDIRVLLLDDDPDLVDLARTVVERDHEGMTVETETDPDAAVERIREGGYDCVVTDYKMGRMDGLDLLRAVRAEEPELPVVFFTGKGSEEIAAEAINLGVTDYIRKDTGLDQFRILGNRIATLVAGQRAMRDAAAADRRIRQVYERITVAFVALDEEFRFTYLNAAAERLLGHDAESLLGEPVFDAFPSGDGTAAADAVREAMAEQRETHTETRLDIGDHHAHVELHAYPSADGVSVFVEDVTETVHREEELEELRTELEITEQQFRTLRQKVSRPPSPFR
ncbi:response regulator [Halosegnis marinus]|uniref:Response regulator n=1 Tax=Halosegnis marinus TaxID=3034023 RepID=A0ABD5ZJZ4_9EURY|nr:response regulator [Halosegnis sp. DT85]